MALMSRVTKTRKSKAEVMDIYANISKFISAKKQDKYGIGKAYWRAFAQELFRLVTAAYLKKSRSRPDDLGNTWPPISKVTKDLRKAKRGWTRGKKYYRKNLIMRETDRLLDSLRPTKYTTGSYRPRKDQIWENDGYKIKFGTNVEYAKYHEDTRPVIPKRFGPWVDKASKKGMKAALKQARSKL